MTNLSNAKSVYQHRDSDLHNVDNFMQFLVKQMKIVHSDDTIPDFVKQLSAEQVPEIFEDIKISCTKIHTHQYFKQFS